MAELDVNEVHYRWVHTVNNVAVVAAGIADTIALFHQSGLDTDSNGAIARSVAGITTWAAGIPSGWVKSLPDWIRTSVAGVRNLAISAHAMRADRLARRHRQRSEEANLGEC